MAGISLDAGCEGLWHATCETTEARLKKPSGPPDCPGAYLWGTLRKLPADRDAYVPVGSKDERADVKAHIAASLGHAAPATRGKAA